MIKIGSVYRFKTNEEAGEECNYIEDRFILLSKYDGVIVKSNNRPPNFPIKLRENDIQYLVLVKTTPSNFNRKMGLSWNSK